MDFVGQLWMPIVIAAALCFFASAVIWMAAPHHKTEFTAPPNQDEIAAALERGNVQAGSYYFPHADRSDKDAFAAAMKKAETGPSGVLYIRPRGPFNMGKTLVQQLLFFLVVSFFVAYLAHHALPVGASYLEVFQVAGTAAFMANWLGTIPESIWFARPWKNQWLQLIDALVYAGVTAGVFGWLWPR
jgi:hypothetical protein